MISSRDYKGIESIVKIHGLTDYMIATCIFKTGTKWYDNIKKMILNSLEDDSMETFYILINTPEEVYDKLIKDIYKENVNVIYTLFQEYSVKYDILSSPLVPKHELCNMDMEMYSLLPKISIFDIIVRIMRFKLNDTISITREKEVYYRIVTDF